MKTFSFDSLDEAIVSLSREILQHGKERATRGFKCLEFPYPVMVEITQPQNRFISIAERKWNMFLPFAESLWLASGTNHMALAGSYVKKLYDYSDDGVFMRAGYGPRIRNFDNAVADYHSDSPETQGRGDQLKFAMDCFQKDINTRQALISIHDPMKDNYSSDGSHLKITKDQPCSRLLQFMVVDGKLNLTVYMRSNDLHFGFSAVNVFNFTFIQEYVANMLEIPMGSYYHVANNLHIYEDLYPLTKSLSEVHLNDLPEYGVKGKGYVWPYVGKKTLKEFDEAVKTLFNFERDLRKSNQTETPLEYKISDVLEQFEMPVFRDWAQVFVKYWNKNYKAEFFHPFLEGIFNEPA